MEGLLKQDFLSKNKVFKQSKLSKDNFVKKCTPKLLFFIEKKNQKVE